MIITTHLQYMREDEDFAKCETFTRLQKFIGSVAKDCKYAHSITIVF